MIDYILPLYEKIKARDRKWLSEKSYLEMFTNIICSMFRYSCDVSTIANDFNFRLELLLRLFGKVGICKDDKGNLIFGKAHYIAPLDFLGRGQKMTITTENGEVYERTCGVDGVMVFNNILGHSELTLGWLCRQLSENEVNEFDLLINARSHPIIIAPDDETKRSIEEIFKATADGKPRSIAFNNGIENGLLGNGDPIKVLTVTDPQTAELFQYYSHYHLDLTERVFSMYGLSTFNTGKMAQTNNLEVSGSLASSMAIPMLNYRLRVEALEQIKEVFDIDIKIEFSDCWKNQLALLQGIDKEALNVEETAEDKEPQDVEDIEEDGEDNN